MNINPFIAAKLATGAVVASLGAVAGVYADREGAFDNVPYISPISESTVHIEELVNQKEDSSDDDNRTDEG